MTAFPNQATHVRNPGSVQVQAQAPVPPNFSPPPTSQSNFMTGPTTATTNGVLTNASTNKNNNTNTLINMHNNNNSNKMNSNSTSSSVNVNTSDLSATVVAVSGPMDPNKNSSSSTNNGLNVNVNVNRNPNAFAHRSNQPVNSKGPSSQVSVAPSSKAGANGIPVSHPPRPVNGVGMITSTPVSGVGGSVTVQPLVAPIPPLATSMKPSYPGMTSMMPPQPTSHAQVPAPAPAAPQAHKGGSRPNPSAPVPVPPPAAPPTPRGSTGAASSSSNSSNSKGTSSKSKKSKSKNHSGSGSHSHSNGGSNVGAHGENTGRWTQEEHRLFLEGLEKHGKGWKKIASLIKSRTVVQIRTHAQKYFQKLAKARHNGEDGDVSMEGRGGVGIHCAGGNPSGLAGGMSIPALSNDPLKRRRSGANGAGGTKRKSIETVVTSAHREGKRLKEVNDPLVLPSISPCLAPFVLPHPVGHPNGHGPNRNMPNQPQMPNSNDLAAPPPPGPTLEESLYRFLTPMNADYSITPPQAANRSAHPPPPNVHNGHSNQFMKPHQAQHPSQSLPDNQNQYIVLPNNTDHMNQFSEGSPTCVSDIPTFPTFPHNKLSGTPPPQPLQPHPSHSLPSNVSSQSSQNQVPPGARGPIPAPPRIPSAEPPQWYARGADVDELLHEADALNWLADSGDLEENFPQSQYPPSNNNNTHNDYSYQIPRLNVTNITNTQTHTPNPVYFNTSSEVVSLSESEGGASHNTSTTNNNTNPNSNNTSTYNDSSINSATDALPPVVSSHSSEDINGLPSLFDVGGVGGGGCKGSSAVNSLSTPNLFAAGSVSHSSSVNLVDDNFSVFDSAMDEQAFVSALLENSENAALSAVPDL